MSLEPLAGSSEPLSIWLANGSPEVVTPSMWAGGAVVAVLIGVLAILRSRVVDAAPPPSMQGRPLAEDEPTVPVTLPGASMGGPTEEFERPEDQIKTQSGIDIRHWATPETDELAWRPATAAECHACEQTNPLKAATLWLRRGEPIRALRAYDKAGATLEAARLRRALGYLAEAAEQFRTALTANPGDDTLRLELIELYLDLGRREEAVDLFRAVAQDGPVRASHRFFEAVALRFEAAGLAEEAIAACRHALTINDALASVILRLRYLTESARLRSGAPGAPPGNAARQLLEQLAESTAFPAAPPVPVDPQALSSLAGTAEVIVGHMAVGGAHYERDASVRSHFVRPLRFALDRVMHQDSESITFAAVDRLLDSPVVLRLVRLHRDAVMRYPEVARRLRVLAKVNHPNISKLTYADRDGLMLRMAIEYLPGGTLREFMTRMPSIGPMLLARLAVQVAQALEASHRAGIVHGDVHIDNVLIGADQRLKLTDFALLPPKADLSNEPRSLDPEDTVPIRPGFQSDLDDFASLIDLLFELSKGKQLRPVDSSPALAKCGDELKELALRIHRGEFTSMSRVRLILDKLIEQMVALASGSVATPPE